METLYTTTPLLETVTRYIKPEMHILLSGHRFSYLPFPLVVNAEFTGVVTSLNKDKQYFVETCVDKGMQIKSTEKSRFVYPLPSEADFIMISSSRIEEYNVESLFFELETHLKFGGFMLLVCSIVEQEQLLNGVCNLDYELIEVFTNRTDCFILMKKGWPEDCCLF